MCHLYLRGVVLLFVSTIKGTCAALSLLMSLYCHVSQKENSGAGELVQYSFLSFFSPFSVLFSHYWQVSPVLTLKLVEGTEGDYWHIN